LNEIRSHHTSFAVDIETSRSHGFEDDPMSGLDPHRSEIRLIQFYAGGDKVYVFDLKKLGGIEALGTEIWKRPMVAHNAVFELKHFIHKGIHPRCIGCTMLLANAILGGRLRSLKVLTSEILGEEISKEEQTSDWSQENLSEEQIKYAASDAVVVYKIFHILYPKLDENGVHTIYNLMRDAQHSIARMELAGVCLDKKSHGSLIELWKRKKIKCEEILRSYLGEDINLNSPKQIGDWIKTQVDVTDWPKTETGRLQVNASSIAQNRENLSIAEPLLKHKAVSKLLSTYGETFANHISPVTNRIHSSFRLGGTATGRLSCTKPNIQNPPRDTEFRKLFIAEKGNVLVVADYSQIELRVAAVISEDEVMLESYRVGDDLHKKTAASILKIDPSNVTKAQRQMAKAVNFGLLFGMGALGLSRYAKNSYGVNMSLKDATRAKRAFLSTYEIF